VTQVLTQLGIVELMTIHDSVTFHFKRFNRERFWLKSHH